MSCPSVAGSCVAFTQQHFVTANDGVYKFATLISTIFDFLGKASTVLLTSLANVTRVCKLTAGVTALISLFCYLYKVTKTGGEGTWMAVASTVTLVMHKLAFFATSLHNFKFISIVSVLKPIGLFGTITGLFSSIFDIGDQALTIHKSNQKIQKLRRYHAAWKKAKADGNRPLQNSSICNAWVCKTTADLEFSTKAEESQKIVAAKADSPTPEQQKLFDKHQKRFFQYDALLRCKDRRKVHLYCNQKLAHLQARIENEPRAQKASWMYIAFDIAFIALCIMTLLLPAPVLLIASLSIAGVAIVSAALDLTSFTTNILLKKKDLPQVSLSVLADSNQLTEEKA